MLDDLIDPFDFCVYDEQHRRHLFHGVSVFRHIQPNPWVFGMWLTAPDGVPNLTPGTILIQYLHPMGSYRTRTDEERIRMAHMVGTAFCVFLQGAVLGWDAVERDVDVEGNRRDQISVGEYTRDTHLSDFLTAIGLDKAGLRTACREDLLTFAVQQHREAGSSASWKARDFLDSGFARLAYEPEMTHELIVDLMHEHKLTGTFGDQETGRTAWLIPDLFEEESDKVGTRVDRWIESIRSIGRENGWAGLSQGAVAMDNDSPKDPRTVFVVHGRDEHLRDSTFQFLRSIGLQPLEWAKAVALTGKASPYVGEVLDAAFSMAGAIVVLFTPDDEARLREDLIVAADGIHERELTPQARANVLFEAGMAMGRSPDRTVLVEVGSLRPFSDIGGRHVIRLDNSTKRRQDFANRLESAGCPVDLKGTDWHTVGDFTFPET